MNRLDRRTLLLGVGIGAASGALGPHARACRASLPADLEALARRFREKSRGEVLEIAARAIASGADRPTILGAIFLAGVEEIRPNPVGNFLHNVMMVESAFLLPESAPLEDTWLAALWALDDFKTAQDADLQRGDWVLPPPKEGPKEPKNQDASLSEARRELEAALEGFDPERADRAVTALLRRSSADEVFEFIWPYAARSFRDAGHRILHSAQIERTLRRVDALCAEPALRTVVIGLASDSDGPLTECFANARELAKAMPERWLEGKDQRGAEDPRKSLEVLRALRGRTPKESQRAVVDALREGLGAATVWDGLRLYASELMLLRPTREHLFPVHSVTEVEAFGHAWSRAKSEATKALLVLQAAAWAAMVRDAVVRNNGPYLEERGIDALGASAERGELAQAVESRSPDAVSAALARDPALAPSFVAGLRAHLVRKGDQNHQFKYAGSILAESRRGHPRWRTQVLAVGVDYLPGTSAPETEVCRRSKHALRAAGVI